MSSTFLYHLIRFLCLVIVSFSFLQQALGKKLSNADSRIVGGYANTIENVKYLVNLHKDGRFICGGALWKERFVITAAHCVVGTSPTRLVVTGGQTNLNGSGVKRNVEGVFVPPQYNPRTHDDDWALVKLSAAMTGPNIKTIAMCNTDPQVGDKMLVSGWGLTNQNANNPQNQVRSVLVPVLSRANCAKSYGDGTLTNTMFCAGVRGEKDSCQGDSGGPGVVNGCLIGIVSWGIGCATNQYPGVYTNVKQIKPAAINAMNMST